MESRSFDRLTRAIADLTSRRAVVRGITLGGVTAALGLGLTDSDDAEARKKRNRQRARRKKARSEKKNKSVICHCATNDPATCSTIKVKKKQRKQHLLHHCDYPGECIAGKAGECSPPITGCTRDSDCTGNTRFCQNRVCVQCRNDQGCAAGQICVAGACATGCTRDSDCPGSTPFCQNQICVACRNSGDCDPEVADTCAAGICQCGSSAPCGGGRVCDTAICVCPEEGTCIVTPSSLGGWVIATSGVEFVTGPETPPAGTGSIEISTTAIAKATFKYPRLAGLAIADIATLIYSTYMQNGSTTGVVVPAIKLPVLYSNGTIFTTLIFEPTYTVGSTVELDEWQTWDLLSANARWWSSKDLPNGICAFNCFVPWADILASIPDAFINPDGLLIETGSGTPNAVGNADKLQVNGATFDFEPD